MSHRLFLLFLGVIVLAMPGCATDPSSSSTTAGNSAIPWNRPESWEGGSGVPGFSQLNEGR